MGHKANEWVCPLIGLAGGGKQVAAVDWGEMQEGSIQEVSVGGL